MGILAEDCNAAPWIVGNELIQGQQGTTRAAGIVARGACDPVIDGNTLITGGGDTSTTESIGISCERNGSNPGSLCAVLGNESVKGSTTAHPTLATGVACMDKSCAASPTTSQRCLGATTSSGSCCATRQRWSSKIRSRVDAVDARRSGSWPTTPLRASRIIWSAPALCPTVMTASPINIGLRILANNDQTRWTSTRTPSTVAATPRRLHQHRGRAWCWEPRAPVAPKGILRNNIMTGGICLVAATTGAPTAPTSPKRCPPPIRALFQNNDLDSVGTPTHPVRRRRDDGPNLGDR